MRGSRLTPTRGTARRALHVAVAGGALIAFGATADAQAVAPRVVPPPFGGAHPASSAHRELRIDAAVARGLPARKVLPALGTVGAGGTSRNSDRDSVRDLPGRRFHDDAGAEWRAAIAADARASRFAGVLAFTHGGRTGDHRRPRFDGETRHDRDGARAPAIPMPESVPSVHGVEFAASRASAGPTRAVGPHERIRFSRAAREQLEALWNASVAGRSERVACLGGRRAGTGEVEVLRIEWVSTEGADIANAPAATSLAQCRPSAWLGTVHTHIVTAQGIPYTTFSAPDRDVIGRWEARFGVPGVFCVLYTDRDAYCEAGPAVAAEVRYRESATAASQWARCAAPLAVLSASRRCRSDPDADSQVAHR